ncbi:hypothetical protein BJY01DRAFT_203917 [Aspergillus pseudoustus]|uniref:Uncharacterized protein n=1 Tax=Aspergillus pseudoustus TaxID=1810923 RepID=A0ABR4KX66_9EURO
MLPKAELPRRKNAYGVLLYLLWRPKKPRGQQLTRITTITNEITILLGNTKHRSYVSPASKSSPAENDNPQPVPARAQAVPPSVLRLIIWPGHASNISWRCILFFLFPPFLHFFINLVNLLQILHRHAAQEDQRPVTWDKFRASGSAEHPPPAVVPPRSHG